MKIYIVRHGETDYNINGRIGGRIDVPLNEKGIEEATVVKEKLKDVLFDKIYSSPLKRAIMTAKIIRDEDIILDDRIMERSNGELEGSFKKDVPDDIDYNDPNETRFGIENILDFRTRINDFLNEVTSCDDECILIVTHAGVGIYMRCYFEGEPKNQNYRSYKMGNCDVLEYSFEKKKTI